MISASACVFSRETASARSCLPSVRFVSLSRSYIEFRSRSYTPSFGGGTKSIFLTPTFVDELVLHVAQRSHILMGFTQSFEHPVFAAARAKNPRS